MAKKDPYDQSMSVPAGSLAGGSALSRRQPAGSPEEGETVIHADERTVIHAKGKSGASPESSEASVSSSPTSALLKVFSGPFAGQEFPLTLEEGRGFILGRDPNVDLVLDDGSVSRRHAEIVRRGAVHYLSDLGSSNGTLVDGQLIYRDHALRHGSELKIGIYPFVFHDPALTDAMLPSTLPVPASSVAVSSEVKSFPSEDDSAAHETHPAPLSREVLYFFIGLGVIGLLLVVFGIKKIFKEGATDGIVRAFQNLFQTNTAPKLAYPIVEIRTSPLAGAIYFQDTYWGVSPQEHKLVDGVRPGDELAVRAEFDLKAIGEKVIVEKKVTFARDQEIASILIEAPIGQIHVKKIPRETQVILEYTLPSKTSENKSVEEGHQAFAPLDEPEPQIRQPKIDYKEPLSVPFGEYKFELRQNEKFRYRRRFTVDAANPSWAFEVSDEDLTFAPVSVITDPVGAEIYLDGVLLDTKTPLKDFSLSFGPHILLLKKDSYQDFILQELPNPLEINEPLIFNVKLPITPVGELILQAKTDYENHLLPSALSTLIQALKTSPPPTPLETAQIQYLLGQVYLNQKNARQAFIYFRKAKEFVDADGKRPFFDKAKVGEARVYESEGNRLKALQLAVEVFFSSADTVDKAAAEEVFHKVSPVRSSLYVDTEPKGATIYFNGKIILDGKKPMTTPMIIHDLLEGGHTLVIVQEGFEDHKEKVRLKLSDLKALKIKMKRL